MKYIPIGEYDIKKSEHIATVLRCLNFDNYKVEDANNDKLLLYLGIDNNTDEELAINKFIDGYIRLSELIQEELLFLGYPVDNILTKNIYYGISLSELYDLIDK